MVAAWFQCGTPLHGAFDGNVRLEVCAGDEAPPSTRCSKGSEDPSCPTRPQPHLAIEFIQRRVKAGQLDVVGSLELQEPRQEFERGAGVEQLLC
eukprot:1160650-Pelagomonas_calceolata.AAC.9